MPAQYDILAYQGDTFTLEFYIDGNFSAHTPRMQLRTTPGAASPTVDLTVANGGIVMAYNGGTNKTQITATITAAVTATLLPATIYYYDFQFTLANVVKTYLAGNFTLCSEVTR